MEKIWDNWKFPNFYKSYKKKLIKRSKKRQETRKFYRVNERIFSSTLRVLESGGKQLGILSKFDALNKARELGLDLVEIAPNAKPPVAKIIDFKKFLYQEEKKKKEEKKKSKTSETKELRVTKTGKVLFSHQYKSHHKLIKSRRRLRRQKEPGVLKGKFAKKIKQMLGKA